MKALNKPCLIDCSSSKANLTITTMKLSEQSSFLQVNVLSTTRDLNITTSFVPRCKDGYGLASQTASLSCQSDGTWSKSSIKCQPNPCMLPSNLSAPHVIITGKELTPVGGTITFSCPPGLHLQGSAVAECQVIHLPPVNHLSNSC